MKVWITKYALTDGILECDARHCTDISDRMINVEDRHLGCFHKPDWHTTREEAVDRSETMRLKKITALKKQIRKLEALKFT